VSLGDDAVSTLLPIGFTFNYYGVDYTQFRISSNGFMYMGSSGGATSGCCNGYPIPSSAQPNNYIAITSDDWYPPGGQRVRYTTTGTAPDRQLHVIFNNVPRCCTSSTATSDTLNGKAILYEGSNLIDVLVEHNRAGSHTIGVENLDGTAGLTAYRGSAVQTNFARRFTICP